MTPRAVLSILALGLASLVSSCSGLELGRYEFSEPKMGTEFRLVLYAESAEQAQRAALRAFEKTLTGRSGTASGGKSTSPESDGFFAKAKELWDDLTD